MVSYKTHHNILKKLYKLCLVSVIYGFLSGDYARTIHINLHLLDLEQIFLLHFRNRINFNILLIFQRLSFYNYMHWATDQDYLNSRMSSSTPSRLHKMHKNKPMG